MKKTKKFNPSLKTISYSIAAIMAGTLASQNAQAVVNINSSTDYSDNLTVSKMKNIADQQAKDALTTARLYDVIKEIAKDPSLSQSTKDYIANNLPSDDVLSNGSTFKLYTSKGSQKTATVDSEPLVRLGAGSTIPLTADNNVDTENVDTIGRNDFVSRFSNFAGKTSDGVVSVGDKASGKYRTITNVSAGRLNFDSTDAVNGSQLHSTNVALDYLATKFKNDMFSITINQVENGHSSEFDSYNVNHVQSGSVINYKEGKNISINYSQSSTPDHSEAMNPEPNPLHNIVIKTKDDLVANSYTVTGQNGKNDAIFNNDGLNMGNRTISNLKDGVQDNDAVNVSQLNKVKKQLDGIGTGGNATGDVYFSDNTGKKTHVALNNENAPLKMSAGSSNVTVNVTDNNSINFDLNRNLDVSDITTNTLNSGGVVINRTGINANNNKITNVADGVISDKSKEAVNGSQLYNYVYEPRRITERIKNEMFFLGINESTNGWDVNFSDLHSVGMSSTLNFKEGDNISINYIEDTVPDIGALHNIVIKTKDNLSAKSYTVKGENGAKDIVLNGNGLDMGNRIISNLNDGVKDNDAVNMSQLNNLKNNLDNIKNQINNLNGNPVAPTGDIYFSDNTGKKTHISLNNASEPLKLSAGSNNITVDVTDEKSVKFDIAKEVELKKVTADELKSNNVIINNQGINAGNQKVSNVADGLLSPDSQDAVNGRQLYDTNSKILENKNKIAQGWNIQDTNGHSANIQMNDTLTVQSGNNNLTATVNPNKTVNLTLSDNLNVNSVTSNLYKTGDINISSSGINAGNKTISNVKDGLVADGSKEAVNGGQLYNVDKKVDSNTDKIAENKAKIKENADNIAKGWNISDEQGHNAKINLGDTLTIKSLDQNLTTTVNNDPTKPYMGIGLANDLRVNSVTANRFSAGNVTISNNGINAGNQKITNVADGIIDANSQDAINGRQLFNALAGLNKGNNNTNNGNVVLYDGNTQDKVTLQGNNGTTISNVKAGNVTATSTEAVNGSQLFETKEDVAANSQKIEQNSADIAKGLNFGDGKGNVTNVQLGGQFNVEAGSDNIISTVDVNKVTVDINPNQVLNSSQYGNVNISKQGLNNGGNKVLNVKAGDVVENSTDAVNGGQLYTTNAKVDDNTNKIAENKAKIKENTDAISKGWNIQDTQGNKSNIAMGDTLNVKTTNNNLIATVSQGNVTFGLADNVNVNSVTTGDVSISNNGVNAGRQKVTNVKDGEVSANSTDAVNGGQLHKVDTKANENSNKIADNKAKIKENADNIAKGWNIQDVQGNISNVKLGETLNVKTTNNNLTATVSQGNVTLGLADDLTANSVTTGNVSISNNGVNAGNQKVTNVKAGDVSATSTDAVNGGQLYATNAKVDDNSNKIEGNKAKIKENTDAIAKGWNIQDAQGNVSNVAMGGTLNVKTSNNNLTATVSKDNVTIGLVDDLNVKSVTTGDVSISNNGVNAGGQKVSNVKAGDISETSTDAINGGQLYETNTKVADNSDKIAQNTNKINKGLNFGDGKGNVTNVKLGEQFNIETSSENISSNITNGKVVLDVNQNQKLNSTKYGDVLISTNGINNGNQKIINLADGDVNETSQDAVNGRQLNEVKNMIKDAQFKGFDVAADSGKPVKINNNDVLNINGGNNIETTVTEKGNIQVNLKQNINVDSITVGTTSINQNGINAGNNRIVNVADGVNPHDAVNVNQLNKVESKINKVASDASSGIAASMAVGTLGQAWQPGSNTVSVAGSVYDGKSGWAIGGSNMTDNGKWLIKYNVSGSGNNKFGGAASVTYQY